METVVWLAFVGRGRSQKLEKKTCVRENHSFLLIAGQMWVRGAWQ